MSQWRTTIFDTALIILGMGCSTWFISTNGHGQNPLPVAAGMVFVGLIAGMISFILARFVPAITVSIIASIVVTDLLFGLYFVCLSAFLKQPRWHGHEEAVMLPIVFIVETAPTVLLAALGFGRFARRFYQRRKIKYGHNA